MKLWLSKNSEVPMREQLVTQVKIGIASNDLRSGEKLPSRGEIARRFGIHENTVSNAYKELAEKGLIEFKKGSGFYVCRVQIEAFETEKDLNSLTTNYLNEAQKLGFVRDEIQASVEKLLNRESPEEYLVIETDKELREILVFEIEEETKVKTSGISFEDFKESVESLDKIVLALSDEEDKIQKILPKGKNCTYLNVRSVQQALQGESRPEKDALIAIVSAWQNFLVMAKTILVAAELESDSIILRSTKEDDWQRGLQNAEMIICDSLTAKTLPNYTDVRPFPLIDEATIFEISQLIKLDDK